MIVVTGTTGHLGRAVVDGLVERVPANRIVARARDPSKAAALKQRGVPVRAGDFTKPDDLRAAFAGATQVLIVSVNQLGEPALRLHRAAIEAARAAEARRVLYTSHMGVRKDSAFVPARDHAATEEFLGDGGAPFTSLRHGFYAESALHLIKHGLDEGELRVPEDGLVSWTARDDLAEADAILLADEGRLDGVTPPLTAPEAFTMADLATIASEIRGREIRHVTVSDDEWRDARVAQGVPAPMAEMLLGMYRAARRGDFAAVDPTLEGSWDAARARCATCSPPRSPRISRQPLLSRVAQRGDDGRVRQRLRPSRRILAIGDDESADANRHRRGRGGEDNHAEFRATLDREGGEVQLQ